MVLNLDIYLLQPLDIYLLQPLKYILTNEILMLLCRNIKEIKIEEMIKMKKWIKLVLIILAYMFLIGCPITTSTFSLDILVNGSGRVVQYPNFSKIAKDSSVLLTAVPDSGYVFLEWTGDIKSSQNPETLTMDKDYSVTATFMKQSEPITRSLSISVDGLGKVVQYPNLSKIPKDSSVQLTAVPDSGYVFSKWSGDIESSQNPEILTMDKDHSVTATFIKEGENIKYRLSANWDSYNKTDKLLNIIASKKSINSKALSNLNFKKLDYFDLDTGNAHMDRAILVKYKSGEASSRATSSLKILGEKDLRMDVAAPFQRIIVDKDKYDQIPNILTYIKSLPEVEYAEEDGINKALSTPNDEYYSFQWNFSTLNMPAAWDITTGENDVIVAVIDTGAYFPLSDLGETKFVQGFDFVNYWINAFDDNGHGSHVSGTIAQSTNNEIGVAGMAPDVKIMPVKVLNSSGYGYSSDIAQGILYAVNNGAHIINMSLGGGYSYFIEQACQYASDHDVLIVAAAGNDSSSNLSYPAAYDTVLSVAAINDLNQLAYYSNYGSGLDVVAPGGDLGRTLHNIDYDVDFPAGILQQTFLGGESVYYFCEGTSMASPHVAALAALLKSKNKNLTSSEIESIIENTTDDLGTTGYDLYFGYGAINPVNALGVPGYIVSDSVVSTIIGNAEEIEKWKISTAPCTIAASLNYFDDKGTLGLYLEDSSGAIVSTGIKTGDAVNLSYVVNESKKGDYYFVVKY